ncbi:hypothetical protein [Helicobacter mastomyrinus]|uniref:Uncharacterized protein n=1 Tax=Helicobacter mastomyrinus TaxID=287948 RepID=A0ABZ3F7G9_9HELI|nr:hypothetical protein [uncultured Helicobacter sp.]
MPKNTIIFEIFPQYFCYRNPQLITISRSYYYSMAGESNGTSMHPQLEHIYLCPSKLLKPYLY